MRSIITRLIAAGLLSAVLWQAQLAAQPAQADAAGLLDRAADAMGGRQRIEAIRTLTMTGFGQSLNQQGGGNPSPDPRAPGKWQAENAVVRSFDLDNGRARLLAHRSSMFPFAIERPEPPAGAEQLQYGIDTLNHPLPALRAALAEGTRLGAVSVEDGATVVEFTISSGRTLWLALDPASHLPVWVRWISGSATLGDVTNTAYFTGYLPFEDVQLPVGITEGIDWRDTSTAYFHVDAYELDAGSFEPVPPRARNATPPAPVAEATRVADGVWDLRVGGNGGAVIEFADHLTMFEAYGSEAATFARLDRANTLVPGKSVTELIVTHHHFDHTGGLRAAVSRGLTVISERGNEGIFREMVARPAPNFPDALARNPQPLKFVPVDEHLVLEDERMRVDVYHAVGHLHMANAVFAYIPGPRIFLEGDFTTYDWDWHWWGGAYLDNVERYGLDPAINIPVHGIVTNFADTIATIEGQVERADVYCETMADEGVYPAGCPVKYSRSR